ncbi:MAG: hypothetical protein EBU57_05595 [Alphaproteobacteria bacterium]|nr:hypothetical protein [Alphaproteobacteria bacterium]
MSNNPKLGYVPVGILDLDSGLAGTELNGVPVVGGVRGAGYWAKRVKTDAVAMPELEGTQLAQMSARLPFPQVLLLPEYQGIQTSWISTRDLNGVLGLEVKKNLLLRRNRMLKRAIDIAGAGALLIFSLPLLLFACIAIMIVSPGNPFYRHEVAGYRMRPFRMFKLRTMYPDAKDRLQKYLDDNPERRPEWLQYLKLRNDPRILPVVGKFLRPSSIDELPQIINVLRGEMSLVGPRPLALYELEVVDPDYVNLRCSVLPGITGMWQVEKRSEGGLEDREEMDTYYIRNWSLWLDIYILCRTFPTVLSGRGAY